MATALDKQMHFSLLSVQLFIVLSYNPVYFCGVGGNVPTFSLEFSHLSRLSCFFSVHQAQVVSVTLNRLFFPLSLYALGFFIENWIFESNNVGTLEISVAPSAGIAGFLGFVLFIYLFF